MKIKFVQSDGSYFAISENAFYNGRYFDELMWAEITPKGDGFSVKWEDAWNKPETIPGSFDEVSKHIFSTHKSHKPHINGASYEAEENEE